jgi:hypothetical protein
MPRFEDALPWSGFPHPILDIIIRIDHDWAIPALRLPKRGITGSNPTRAYQAELSAGKLPGSARVTDYGTPRSMNLL